MNTKLSPDDKDNLFSGEFTVARTFFDQLEEEGERLITEQENRPMRKADAKAV